MAGKIKKLRLGCCATLKILAPDEEADQDIKAEQSGHKNPLESLTSVSYLRYPRRQDESDRYCDENEQFMRALGQKRSRKFPSFSALQADQERRRQRLDFVVNQEDDPIGDLGTVLVLTRPTPS